MILHIFFHPVTTKWHLASNCSKLCFYFHVNIREGGGDGNTLMQLLFLCNAICAISRAAEKLARAAFIIYLYPLQAKRPLPTLDAFPCKHNLISWVAMATAGSHPANSQNTRVGCKARIKRTQDSHYCHSRGRLSNPCWLYDPTPPPTGYMTPPLPSQLTMVTGGKAPSPL